MIVTLSIPFTEYLELLTYARAKKFIHVKPVESVKGFVLYAAGQHMKKYPLSASELAQVEKNYGMAVSDASASRQSAVTGESNER